MLSRNRTIPDYLNADKQNQTSEPLQGPIPLKERAKDSLKTGTPILDYAKAFREAGLLEPRKLPAAGTAAGSGLSARAAQEEDKLLEQAIRQCWQEEDQAPRRNLHRPVTNPKAVLANTGILGYDDLNSGLFPDRFRLDDCTDLNTGLTAGLKEEPGGSRTQGARHEQTGPLPVREPHNPYGHMGILDADYGAYRAGKLTREDLLGIAQAAALYRAADGSYHYQNAAHDRAAKIRIKYDPHYIKTDSYDYTHGGRYDPHGAGPIPGPPVYEIPGRLAVDARPGTGQGNGHAVFGSSRPPKMMKKNRPAPDFGSNDKEKSDLYQMGSVMGGMAELYDQNTALIDGKALVERAMKSLAAVFSAGDAQMRAVAEEMFDHFISGNGEEYRSPILTERVLAHASTQDFIIKTMQTVQRFLALNCGDLSALTSDKNFEDKMEIIHTPKFNTRGDLLGGLTICLNDTWGYTIDIADYRLEGTRYTGTLRYTLYDHFGLDESDLTGDNWYKGAFAPFAAWYVLQHYTGCEGSYQPFVTCMEFEVPFGGSIN